MEFVLGIFYLGVIVYLANYNLATGERGPVVHLMLYGALGIMAYLGITVVMLALFASSEADANGLHIAPFTGLIYLICAIVACVSGARVLNNRDTRAQFAQILGDSADYDPDSIVHTTAVIIMMFVLLGFFATFLLAGGQQGVTETLESSPPTLQGLFLDAVVYIGFACLGIGLFIRRTGVEAIGRLKLRVPQAADIRAGTLTGLGLYGLLIIVSLLWTAFVPPEVLQQQTAASEIVFAAFSGSLLTGVLLALSTSISEEILFRGALQPVFGNVLTSIFFALVHLQYTLTPAVLVIFIVSMGFGWLRARYSTTAAIIGHFIYNLIPFLLFGMASLLEMGA